MNESAKKWKHLFFIQITARMSAKLHHLMVNVRQTLQKLLK